VVGIEGWVGEAECSSGNVVDVFCGGGGACESDGNGKIFFLIFFLSSP